MAKRTFRNRVVRLAAVLAVGGSAFQLSGCDPAVRSSLLAGLENTTNSLTDALVSAFFLTLQDDSATGGGGSTTATTN